MVRSAVALPRLFTANRIAAMVLWLVGVYTTQMAVSEMGAGENALLMAVGLQIILTVGQRPVWRRSRWGLVGIVFVGVDVFFNFGGVWPFAQNIDKTTAWSTAVNAFYGQAMTAPAISRALFGLLISTAIAAGVEWLWYESEG